MIVDAFRPNETLLELEKVTAERFWLVVPALKLTLAPGLIEAVIVEPLRPNETPFEFEKVTAERLFDVVPALTLMFVRLVATEAVIVEALSPKLTPFELEKVKALARLLVVPAERLIRALRARDGDARCDHGRVAHPEGHVVGVRENDSARGRRLRAGRNRSRRRRLRVGGARGDRRCVQAERDVVGVGEGEGAREVAGRSCRDVYHPWVLATVTLAVTTELFDIPKVTLFELEKTTVPLVAVCEPAAIAPGAVDCSALAEAVMIEALRPKETLFELEKVHAETLLLVVPAEMLTSADAVTRLEPDIPKVMLFELEKTTVPEVAVCVPAAMAPGAVDCE